MRRPFTLRWLLFIVTSVSLLVVVGITATAVERTAQHQLAHYERVRDVQIARHIAHQLGVADRRGGWTMVHEVALESASQLGSALVIRTLAGSLALQVGTFGRSAVGPKGVTVPFRRGRAIVGTMTLVNPPSFEPKLSPVLKAIERALIIAAILGLALALAISWWLGGFAVRALEHMSLATRSMAEGQREVQVPIEGVAEAQQLAQNFNAMTKALAVSERSQHQLVADMAHELRTPLSVLAGYLEAVEDGILIPGSNAYTVIHDQTQHLIRLVGDLQTLALADADELSIQPEAVDLRPWLGQFLTIPSAEAKRLGLDFRQEIPSNLPTVRCDPDRLGQALQNFLQNAFKYTPTGGTVTVSATADPSDVTIAVEDTGMGVQPGELPYLFDRLYRTDPARARDTGGSGLGLPLAKKLIELQGGQVGVDSVVGKGSRFWLKIPR